MGIVISTLSFYIFALMVQKYQKWKWNFTSLFGAKISEIGVEISTPYRIRRTFCTFSYPFFKTHTFNSLFKKFIHLNIISSFIYLLLFLPKQSNQTNPIPCANRHQPTPSTTLLPQPIKHTRFVDWGCTRG